MSQTNEIPFNVVKASEITGVDVKNAAGDSLGSIKEIILDKRKGEVRYIVLSFGGFLGMGDKLFALPWNSISYDEEMESFILNVDKEKIKNAPGFDKDNWPNMSDRAWEKNIYTYYGSRPYWME